MSNAVEVERLQARGPATGPGVVIPQLGGDHLTSDQPV